MMKTTTRIVAMAAAIGWGATASAQGIWRCGDSYTQQPCPGGRPVEAQDSRTSAERQQTLQAVERDTRMGESLEKSRVQAEAQPAPAYMPPPKPDALSADPGDRAPAAKSAKKTPYFTAMSPKKPKAPKTPKKKKKAA
jgi:hypothetical protein